MDKDFWLERWERQEIGFHQSDINPHLRRYWQELHLSGKGEVFVPLCGKSRDMLWLREQGHTVLGVELSGVAVQSFFRENSCAAQRAQDVQDGKFEPCEAEGIRILCGDFFDLNESHLEGAGAVYDRASLVALPPEMRERYVHHLTRILPPATQILLVAFDYPQEEMSGPPFAVSAAEIGRLFSEYAEVCLLAQLDALPQNPRFQERGLSRLQESIFLLTLR